MKNNRIDKELVSNPFVSSIYEMLKTNNRLKTMRKRCDKWFNEMDLLHIFNIEDLLSYFDKKENLKNFLDCIKQDIDQLYEEWYEGEEKKIDVPHEELSSMCGHWCLLNRYLDVSA